MTQESFCLEVPIDNVVYLVNNYDNWLLTKDRVINGDLELIRSICGKKDPPLSSSKVCVVAIFKLSPACLPDYSVETSEVSRVLADFRGLSNTPAL